MIFQDPLESLDPLFSIGSQLQEVLRVRGGLSRADARGRPYVCSNASTCRTPRGG